MAMIAGMGMAAVSAIGSLGKGFAGSTMAQLQAGIANQNTQLLLSKAQLEAESGQLALDQGSLQQSRTMLQLQRTLGGETAGAAAKNLDPTYGSPLLLERYSAGQGATDLALIGAQAGLGRAQALSESAGTMAQAVGSQGHAVAFRAQETQDMITGILGAATSLLGGAGSPSVAPMWANLFGATNAIATGSTAWSPAGGTGITVSGGALW